MALHKQIYDAVVANLPVALGIESLFGEECLSNEGNFPRIVWVPQNDNFGPPTQRGTSRTEQRAIHTARSAVDAHCWGGSTELALDLRDVFVQALRSTIGPNYHLQGGRWIGQQNVAAGRVYALSFFLDIPIVEVAPAIATPTSAPLDVQFSNTLFEGD